MRSTEAEKNFICDTFTPRADGMRHISHIASVVNSKACMDKYGILSSYKVFWASVLLVK